MRSLYITRVTAPVLAQIPTTLRRAGTFVLVIIGWVFFRSTSFGMAKSMLRKMFQWTDGPEIAWAPGLLLMVAIAGVIAHLMPNTFELRHEWNVPLTLLITALFGLCLVVIYGGQASPFLYFQF